MKRVALITGSTRGLGLAMAKALASQNYHVVINSAKSVKEGQALAKTLPNASYVKADVTQVSECENLVQACIKQHGQLDVLINNAVAPIEVISMEKFLETSDDLFLSNFNTNVLASWRLSKLAYPYLKQSSNGNIINISSIAGSKVLGASIPYAVSKAGLNHLTLLLAKAMAPEVRVNAIAPGIMNTERVAGEDAKHLRESLIEKTQLKRLGEPKDIILAMQALLSNEYVTGEIMTVDGGLF